MMVARFTLQTLLERINHPLHLQFGQPLYVLLDFIERIVCVSHNSFNHSGACEHRSVIDGVASGDASPSVFVLFVPSPL